jgi:hypothetical protein
VEGDFYADVISGVGFAESPKITLAISQRVFKKATLTCNLFSNLSIGRAIA